MRDSVGIGVVLEWCENGKEDHGIAGEVDRGCPYTSVSAKRILLTGLIASVLYLCQFSRTFAYQVGY